MIEGGFYVIKDQFFLDFPDPYLKANKVESRPHYFALHDIRTGLFWMIPMSSRVEKYERIITRITSSGRRCDTLHILKLDNDRSSVFLVQDIFPISANYCQREYTINGNHLRLTSEAQARIIRSKATRVIGLIRNGVRFMPTQADVLKIEKSLRNVL